MNLRFRRPATALLPLLAVGILGCDSEDPAPAEAWVGRSYVLDVPVNNWVDPPGVGSEIGAYVPLFMFGINDVDGDDVSLLMGTATEDETQDPCNPTTEFTGVVETYPNIEIGPKDFEARIRNGDVEVMATVHDLTMSNVLAAEGEEADEGTLTAVMDIRDVYPLFTLLPDPTPDSVCMSIENFGSSCEPCPFDDSNYCLALRAVQLGAVEVPEVTLEERSADEAENCE